MANTLSSSEETPRLRKHEDDLLYKVSFFAVAGIGFLMYWRSVGAPFIQDDWRLLYTVIFRGQLLFILEKCNPAAGGFFRPLGSLYLLMLYNIFRLDPTGYHLLALTLHAANSCLVILLLERITYDRFVAWAGGMFYAASALVHIDTVFWIVGAYDLLGAGFFLLSFYFYVDKKPKASLIFYGFAVLSKEATLVLPLVLAAYELLIVVESPMPFRQRLIAVWTSLRYYFAIMGTMVVIVIAFVLPSVSATSAQPYATEFIGLTLAKNLFLYLKWCFEGIIPLIVSPDIHDRVMIGLVLLAVGFQGLHAKRDWRLAAFLLCWFIIGLLPVLPLAQHAFRYYTVYSLPAFFAFLILPVRFVPEKHRQLASILVSVCIIANIYAGTTFVAMLDEKWADVPAMEGANIPARKAGVVTTVSDFFHSTYKAIPESTIFVVNWFNTGPIGGNAALCIWYNDPTLRVAEIQQLQSDSNQVAFDERLSNITQDDEKVDGPRWRKITNSQHLIILDVRNGVIRPRR
jgi:hypothetical protein